MADAAFQEQGGGRYRVRGALTFQTAAAVLRESEAVFTNPAATLDLDLGEVERVDSAGLALLIEWLRLARAAGKSVRFHGASPQMRSIARVSDLEDILPF